MEKILRSLNYVQCLNIAPVHSLWPQWNKASKEKALRLQWNITPWFIAPMEKAWFYERLFFKVVIVLVKELKIQYKRYNVYKNEFYALYESGKSNVTGSLGRI